MFPDPLNAWELVADRNCSFDARETQHCRHWLAQILKPTLAPSNPPTDTGAQPLISDDGNLFLAVNGEIYNHRILRKQLKGEPKFKTHSDCEVILHLVSIQIPRAQKAT